MVKVSNGSVHQRDAQLHVDDVRRGHAVFAHVFSGDMHAKAHEALMRTIAIVTFAAVGLAGCATTGTTYLPKEGGIPSLPCA